MSISREYEITYTIDPRLEEPKRDELNMAIDGKINEHKGSISTNSETTRRKLAYPIHKQRMGFLRLIQAQIPAETVAKLRHDLSRLSGVLRVAVIQSAPRPDVTSAIFETIAKQQTEPKAAVAAIKKPTKAITDQEVEDKIAEALDEEVK